MPLPLIPILIALSLMGTAFGAAGLGLQGAQHHEFIKQIPKQKEYMDLQLKIAHEQLAQIERDKKNIPIMSEVVPFGKVVTRKTPKMLPTSHHPIRYIENTPTIRSPDYITEKTGVMRYRKRSHPYERSRR